MLVRRRFFMPCGIVVLSILLAGCIVVTAPRPIETRLPPGFDGQSAQSPTPSMTSVTPGTPTPASEDAGSPPVEGDVGDVACGDGGSQTVSGDGRAFRVTGSCGELTVAGSALTVDASDASVATLRISGDRILVQVAGADSVIVQGNDGAVTSATGIGRLEIFGDRTTTNATAGIPSVTVRGQDNVVRSGGRVGSAVVEGSGNSIR